MTAPRTDPQFFEEMYARDPGHDPWSFASDAYERNRYRSLLDALPRERFRRCFEPGCSIGELTRMLAERCDEVVALDVSATAIEQARERHADVGAAAFGVGSLPDDLRDVHGSFDLVCLSEVGYYFDEERLAVVAAAVAARLEPGGVLLAGHWTGSSPDHVLGGEHVHDILHCALTAHHEDGCGFHWTAPRRRYPGFVVDVWQRPDNAT